jgi:Na+/H+-translocating membrane pyrophosphatase
VLLHSVLVLQFQIGFQVDIAIPEVFVGGLLGSMLIFLFSAWACAAVGRTAQEVVKEVRRQFIERPGIMVSINFFSNLCIVL